MTQQGHNSGKIKKLAERAREGLKKVAEGNNQTEEGLKQVAEGEDKTIEGWRQYGAALNEGRRMFPSNNEFHEWKESSLYQLGTSPRREDESAAMWAAANPEEFEATREAYPRVRTVRGLHAKWKKEQKPEEEPDEDDTDDDEDVVDNGDEDTPDEDTPDTGKGKPKKAKGIVVPDYDIQDSMGCIKGVAQSYCQGYEGTNEEAADILFGMIVKGCEQSDVDMSIARSYAKWFLELKKVMDIAEPEVRKFLKREPKLNVVK